MTDVDASVSSSRVVPEPPVNPENQRYFDAAAKGILLVGRCDDCRQFHFYPRVLCPHCLSTRTQWVAAKGTGSIYAYSTLHRGAPVPFAVAYVALDEGVTMLSNIVGCPLGAVRIGLRVEVVFQPTENGTLVPMFRPA